MVKTRMTTVDVAAEVRCLRRLIGMRCANIYDLSPTTYVFKFAKSSGISESGESERALVLLESGVRLHSTEFSRDKSSTPSGFTLKLRKHLRTRRLEDVRQLGIDRVVDFQFGLGETAHHIILEVYGQGNLLLTDADYNILQLLRSWKNEEKGLSMVAHQRYPFDACRVLERTTKAKLAAMIQSKAAPKVEDGLKPPVSDQDAKKAKPKWGKEGAGKGSKGTEIQQKGATTTLKNLLGDGLGYGPILIEHIILDASLQPDKRIVPDDGQQLVSETDFIALMEAVEKFEDWLEAVVKGETIPEGYIFMQKPISGKKQQQSAAPAPDEKFDSDKEQMYDEFYPLVLRQLETRDQMKFETFDAAMDDFFGKVEGQRAQRQRKTQENSAMSKLEKIRADQTNRAKALEREVDQSVRMAELIEYNLADVDAGISAVRAALAGGMDWKDLGRMIKEEKKAGNPVAGLIHSLQLETDQITLLLSNNLDDMDEEEKTRPVDKVEVDLSLSAHANARRWFETKKRHATKQEKTLAAHEKAFKAAEKKTQQNLAQAKTVAAITHIRKVHWFEKFNWFISSENYLVISGRDAQQNELLVKRYMKKGDLYVHADLHGASTTIIKNHNPDHPIPPLTINQAGCFTMCRSQAWESKIVTSAWWVEASQVSKTAPTGEYLTVGSFMVRGKKNFLPPNPLVMGYGFLFRLDDSSLGAHLNERQVRGEEDGGEKDLGLLDADLPVENSSDVRLQEDGGIEHVIEDQKGEEGAGAISPDSGRNMEDGQLSELDNSIDDGDSEAAGGFELVDLLDEALQLRSAPKAVRGSGKYALEDLPKTADNDAERPYAIVSELLNVSNGAVQRGKPYLSKAERRKLKKGGTQGGNLDQKIGEDTSDVTTEDVEVKGEAEKSDDDGESSPEVSASDRGPGKAVESSSTKPGRGRKGKLKKIKGKYSEQDEEERELRMSLLASAGRRGAETAIAAEGNDKHSKSRSSAFIREERSRADLELGQKVCYKCKKTGHIARDCPEDGMAVVEEMKAQQSNGEANTEIKVSDQKPDSGSDDITVVPLLDQEPPVSKEGGGKKDGPSRRAYAKAAKEEIAVIMAEENVLELGEDEKEKLTELDSLTGKPLPSDILLYAVPMCGPYSALQGFKYRVKLTPGSAKRGKAAKVAVDVFARMQEVSAREKQLMKAVTDPELFACMIGNAKVTAPGLTKLNQTSKKSNKASAKLKS